MVADSHDVEGNLTVQRFWLEEAAPRLHQPAALSPAVYSCSPISDQSLFHWSVCMCVYGGLSDSNQSGTTGQRVHVCVLPATRASEGVHIVWVMYVHLWSPVTIKLG